MKPGTHLLELRRRQGVLNLFRSLWQGFPRGEVRHQPFLNFGIGQDGSHYLWSQNSCQVN